MTHFDSHTPAYHNLNGRNQEAFIHTCTDDRAAAPTVADRSRPNSAYGITTTEAFVITNRFGQVLRSVNDWERLAPPKSRTHWKDNRSAKELARAWFRRGRAAVPFELTKMFATNEMTNRTVLTKGVAEYHSSFDSCRGEPSNCDLMLYGHAGDVGLVIGEEAKADESFADTVENTLKKANRRPRTNFPTLCRSL